MKSFVSSAMTTSVLDAREITPADRATWPLPDLVATRDDEIAAGVREELIRSGRLELRTVRITVHRGRVRLHGRVSSYYLKQLAQAAALATEGVQAVENELVVI